ncbi:complement regulator-acquiring protein [Borreliella lusitaniae]|uniref:Complement regulator-acquiring protein n=1 Tax=Borreliella lusitaniae TaxID=100177 RepID=A0ABZ0CPJ6_9SPIR|nr:complement regulator-acquiring protein [Borreliella lusitaniae]WNY69175.1 complement regulator-acquiring protein [Borreliella lusitaniae]
MKKPKINIIKLNIITAAIITLICISCKPNSTPLELKNEISKNIKDLKPLGQKLQNRIILILQKDTGCKNQKYTDYKKQKEASGTQNFNPLKNEVLKKSTKEKLQIISTNLENQKAQEDREIAKIAASNYDFLSTFKNYPDKEIPDYRRMQLKRMIYSSLGYEKQKIEALKKNLEKSSEKNKDEIQELLDSLITIQINLENSQEIIKLHNQPTEEEGKKLLKEAGRLLDIKEQFSKYFHELIEYCN